MGAVGVQVGLTTHHINAQAPFYGIIELMMESEDDEELCELDSQDDEDEEEDSEANEDESEDFDLLLEDLLDDDDDKSRSRGVIINECGCGLGDEQKSPPLQLQRGKGAFSDIMAMKDEQLEDKILQKQSELKQLEAAIKKREEELKYLKVRLQHWLFFLRGGYKHKGMVVPSCCYHKERSQRFVFHIYIHIDASFDHF